MTTLKSEKTKNSRLAERERLDLVEKKIGIQRKRIEIKKENLEIEENMLRRHITLQEEKAILDKISELRSLLAEWTIDSERTLLASEPFLAPAIDGQRREFLLNKITDLIRKI